MKPKRPLQDVFARGLAGYVGPGGGLLLACSGGPDSTALLHLALQYRREAAPGLRLGVAHLDHGLRGREGHADARFVEDLAREAGLPFAVQRSDVAAQAGSAGLSLEEAGREARYAFLAGAARRMGLGAVATGHTRDDAAETLLLRLLRGAARTGLCGMRPVRPLADGILLVRPLIEVSRAEVLEFLRECGASYRTDSSNEDPRFDRNRLRREVLPVLERFASGSADRLARTSQVLAAEEVYLEGEAVRFSERVLSRCAPGEWRLDRTAFSGVPEGLRARVLRVALRRASGSLRRVGAVHLRALLEAAAGERGGVDLPSGWRAEPEGRSLRFLRSARNGEGRAQDYCLIMAIPGRLMTPTGYMFDAHRMEKVPAPQELRRLPPTEAILDADSLGAGVRVRTRRPGDRIRPLGLEGRSRKLQDLFVDRKVPRGVRDLLPIVEAAGGIAWVPGVEVGEPFRVRRDTRGTIRVRLAGPGGPSDPR